LRLQYLIRSTLWIPRFDSPHTRRSLALHTYLLEIATHSKSDQPLTKGIFADDAFQVNVPKTRRTYCKGKDCKKHTQHKVTR
jgi:hypothetical protein